LCRLPGDVGSKENILGLVKAYKATGAERLDVLINNCGIDISPDVRETASYFYPRSDRAREADLVFLFRTLAIRTIPRSSRESFGTRLSGTFESVRRALFGL
jgi:hypothetical protein